MNQEQTTLHDAIAAHRLDGPGSTRTFVERLAHENGWSRGHAGRVVAEYRKFVFLAMAGGHLCSPSHAVDQAWHLHLCDTRDYWERFCPGVLGRPLHHEPDRGGAGEGQKLRQAYHQTLASYRAFFGSEPPADIWPAACHAPTEETRPGRRLLLAAAGALLLPGCDAPVSLFAAGIVGGIALLAGFAGRDRRRDRRGGSGGAGDTGSTQVGFLDGGGGGGEGCDPATGDCGDTGGSGSGCAAGDGGGGGAACGGGGGGCGGGGGGCGGS